MKKTFSIFVTFAMLLSLLVFSPMTSFSQNELDQMGFDPWLNYHHDSHGSKFSRSDLQLPIEEAKGSPFEMGGGRTSFLSRGVVVHNGVYYTQYMPDIAQTSSQVFALDVESGDELWSVDLEGSSAWSTAPCIDVESQLLYVGVGRRGFFVKEGEKGRGTTMVYALSMEDEGDEAWSVGVQGTYSGGMVFDPDDRALYVRSIFFKNITDGEYSIADDGSMITKIDVDSGEIMWERELTGAWYFEWDSPPVVSDGKVYTSTSTFKMSGSGTIAFGNPIRIYALDSESGDIAWESDGRTEDSRLCGGVAVDEDYAYICFTEVAGDNANIKLYAFAKDSGDLDWEFSTSGVTYWPTPIYNDEYVFFVSQSGSLYAINKETGKSAWNKSVGNISYGSVTAVTDKYVIASALTTSGNTLSGSKVQMFDIEAKGKKVWEEKYTDRIGHIAIYGHYVIVSGMQGIYTYKSEVPMLEVKPERVSLGEIERNTPQTFTLSIRNTGVPGLKGSVSVSDPEWLSVEPTEINDTTKEVVVTVNPASLDLTDYRGFINFDSNGGKKAIPVSVTIVDTTPPVININTDDLITIDDLLYTNQVNYLLKGQTEATAIVVVQGKDVELDADGIFETTIELKEGKNEILIEATDEVGNEGQSTFVLYLDSKAPVVTITTPNYKLSVDPNDYLMGTVDDLKAVVTVNGEELQLAPNGSFAKMVFLARGVNEFTIQAKDRVGNVTELKHYLVFPEKKLIILFIGRKTAEINGIPVTLDVPPRIMSGRTMVPFRFIGEAMGAEVAWEASEQKITLTLFGKQIVLRIGSTTAMVNGNPVVLDAPPTIIGGRTLVPIRFVSESLGAKVDWEGTQQRITITFPAS
jgi:outer membrane protein assembly factor BamB